MAAKINTFVFLNIGKKGLETEDDYYGYRVKVCAKAVTREELKAQWNVDDIRLFAFEPLRHYGGESLIHCNLNFDEEEKESFIDYLAELTAPVALVAFNGYRFQFPILRAAIGKLPGIRCVDLLDAIYELENYLSPPETSRDCLAKPPPFYRPVEDMMSYRFPDVYERMMQEYYPNHVQTSFISGKFEPGLVLPNMKMWIECAMGIWRTFIRWSDVNATKFNGGLYYHQN